METKIKKIYFVRHGESEGNAGPIRQKSHASLTEEGNKQAILVAERLSKISFDCIVSSSMSRAKETAEIIAQKCSKFVDVSDLFAERRRPSIEYGKPKDDPECVEAERTISENFHIPGFRFSDEENFDDLKNRAKEILDYLATRKEESIVVVTHGFIMRIVLAYAIFGESLNGEMCTQCIRAFHMKNTGITMLEYNESNKNPWWLWVWNDHAHLD